MAQIPPDQKFHTLNPNTPTVERGSAQADGLREIYTMQDIIDSVTTGGGIDFVELGDTPDNYTGAAGQAVLVNPTEDGLIFGAAGDATATKVKVKLGQDFTLGGVATISGFDAVEGVPIVNRINVNSQEQAVGIIDTIQNGVQTTPTSGDVVDMTINGLVERFRFYDVDTGAGPAVGDIVYNYNAYYFGSDIEWDYIPLGRISAVETPIGPGGNGFISMIVNLPEANAVFADGVMAVDSHRSLAAVYNGDLHIGDIVKIGSDSVGTYVNAKRWDPAGGDTPSQIVGVCQYWQDQNGATGDGLYTGVCFSGSVDFDSSVFVGTTPRVGDAIYTDVTTPYKMTSNPASGIQVGTVISDKVPTGGVSGTVKILFNAPGSGGGGATEGEKLDFTVRSDAYAATGDHEGTDLKIGGAASVTAGTVYYWNGDWAAADNTAVGTSTGMIAVATDTGTAVNMLKDGIIQLAANPAGASAGDVLYVGTSGTLTITAPTGSGEIVRVAGHTIDTAGLIYFNPSVDWLEIV